MPDKVTEATAAEETGSTIKDVEQAWHDARDDAEASGDIKRGDGPGNQAAKDYVVDSLSDVEEAEAYIDAKADFYEDALNDETGEVSLAAARHWTVNDFRSNTSRSSTDSETADEVQSFSDASSSDPDADDVSYRGTDQGRSSS